MEYRQALHVFLASTHTHVCTASPTTQFPLQIDAFVIINVRYADYTILMAESKEELKSLLMKVKEEIEKAGLKLKHIKPTA